MIDQAHALRTLMQQRRGTTGAAVEASSTFQPAAVLAFTSAKGGVGKTTLALHSAIQLARAGWKVCIWDVDGNASHDLLAGFHHAWSLTHILTGARSASEVLAAGPAEIRFLLGSGVHNLTSALLDRSESLHAALSEWQRQFDVIVLDLPTVNSPGVRTLVEAAHSSWLVCTPEPAAIAASYACLKQTPSLLTHASLLLNQVSSPEMAFDVIDRLRQTTRMFLQHDWQTAGYIPHDRQIESVIDGIADSPAAKELRHLINHWGSSMEELRTTSNSFLMRLAQGDDRVKRLLQTA